jgi:acylpyruvate hydrolase
MRLATLRTGAGSRAVRIEGDAYAELEPADVGTLLTDPGWLATAAAGTAAGRLDSVSYAPVVPRPGKIFCVGLNYRAHILEMGRGLPGHPTLFAKFPAALIGPADRIQLPPESFMVDWEAELAIVIGARVRRASGAEAHEAIAGFSVLNDVTMRDWQYRTTQWLQGKTFESSSPLGPVLVTPDELPGGTRPDLRITCTVNGETVQEASTRDLVFDPVALVEYISTLITLEPGDLIATGTPGGVGHGCTPPRYLAAGDVVVTEIEGIGRLTNQVVAEEMNDDRPREKPDPHHGVAQIEVR